MLDEIIDAIGLENIEKVLEDVEIKNTVVLVLKGDKCEKVIFDSKESTENLEVKSYIKERVFYIKHLTSNKSVVIGKKFYFPKIMTSANKYSLCFNVKKLFEKIDTINNNGVDMSIDDGLETLIKEYFICLLKYTDNIDCCKEMIDTHFENIKKEVKDPTNKNKTLLVLIDKSLEDYKEEFNKYLGTCIFDKDSQLPNGKGRFSAFSGVNVKKPLLASIGGKTEEIQLYNKEKAIKLYETKFYFDNKFKETNNLKIQNGSGEIIINYDIKDKNILSYDSNPFLDIADELKATIPLIGACCAIEEKNLNSYKSIVEEINKLTANSLMYEKKDSLSKRLYYKYKQLFIYKYSKNDKWIFQVDKEFLVRNIKSILKDVVSFNDVRKNKEINSTYNIERAINLKLNLNNYFNSQGGKLMEDFSRIKKEFVDKLNVINKLHDMDLQQKEEMINKLDFHSLDEALFVAGQLASYLCRKSKSKHFVKLLANYQSVKTYGRVLDFLKSDMIKYNHDIYINSKEAIIYAEIKKSLVSIREVKITEEHLDWFEIGLFGNNLFYLKKED